MTVTYVKGEIWSDSGLVRISKQSQLALTGKPEYLKADIGDTAISFRNFTEFDNIKERSAVRELFRHGSVWIRADVRNPTPDTCNVVLRLYDHCDDFSVYYKKGSQYVHLGLGAFHHKELIPGSYYEAAPLLIPPGVTTLYFNHKVSKNKWALQHIDILHPDEIVNDREESLVSRGYFNFILFAFILIILFQVCYIGIQTYFHRSIEYYDYLVYLVLIGCYFQIRFELVYNEKFLLYFLSPFASLLNDILLFLPYLFYLRFSRHFIGMAEKFPDKNKQIKYVEYIIALMVLVLAVVSVTGGHSLTSTLAFSFVLPLFIYTIWLFLFFYKRRTPIIKFFLIGSICAATGHFLALLLSVFPTWVATTQITPIYFTMTGLVFEIFFFNTGLGYKAKQVQDEKLQLQLEYYRQIEETRRAMDTLQHMRNSIASDLHDDVGSTLSSIGIYSQLASQQIDENPEATKGILDKIWNASQRMMEAMSDIVWAIHTRNDEGIDLFARMRQFASEHLELSEMDYQMEVDKGAMKLSFTMEARRNLMLLFKEIIHNAAKYSKGNLVSTKVVLEAGQMVITVKDNGAGFDIHSVKNGHGLPGYNMRTKSLGGNFTIHSSDEGTEVKIWLPVSKITS